MNGYNIKCNYCAWHNFPPCPMQIVGGTCEFHIELSSNTNKIDAIKLVGKLLERLAEYEDAEEKEKQACDSCKHEGLYEKQAAYGFKKEIKMQLYDEINQKIIKILRLGESDNMQLYAAQLIETLLEENKQLRFMIDNGLGWEDMINDIPDAYQPK